MIQGMTNAEIARANELRVLMWVGTGGRSAAIGERRLGVVTGTDSRLIAGVLGRCIGGGLVALRGGRYVLTPAGRARLDAARGHA